MPCDILFRPLGPKLCLGAAALLEAVQGNSDCDGLKSLLPQRKEIEVDGSESAWRYNGLACGFRPSGDGDDGKEMDVRVLVFGHIHLPLIEKGKGLLVCTGSTTLTRRLPWPSLRIVDGNVRGRIIPMGSPACNYLKFAGELERNGLNRDFAASRISRETGASAKKAAILERSRLDRLLAREGDEKLKVL